MFQPWIWGTAGGAVVSALAGAGLAAYASTTAPGSVATTGSAVTIDDLETAATRARSSALAADILFGVAAASGMASIALGIVAGAPESPLSPRVRRAALVVRPGSAAFEVRFP